MLNNNERQFVHNELLKRSILIPTKCVLLTFNDVSTILDMVTSNKKEEKNDGHRTEEESKEGIQAEDKVDEGSTKQPDPGSNES